MARLFGCEVSALGDSSGSSLALTLSRFAQLSSYLVSSSEMSSADARLCLVGKDRSVEVVSTSHGDCHYCHSQRRSLHQP